VLPGTVDTVAAVTDFTLCETCGRPLAEHDRHTRYNHSEKGLTRSQRYDASHKGRARKLRYEVGRRQEIRPPAWTDSNAVQEEALAELEEYLASGSFLSFHEWLNETYPLPPLVRML
jgi:hypothetical protein